MSQQEKTETNTGSDQAIEKKKINKKFMIILSVMVLIGIIIGGYVYVRSLSHITTDDAQINANLTPIIPKVSGYVEKVYVSDYNTVAEGDTLFMIRPEDYLAGVAEARSELEQAKSQLIVAQARIGLSQAEFLASHSQVGSAQGNIESAKVKLRRAQKDFDRFKNLYDSNSIPKQQFEKAEAARDQAQKELDIMQHQKQSSSSKSKAADVQTKVSQKQISVAKARVKSAQAQLDKAQLDLEYTVVRAPTSGKLSGVDLQKGRFVKPGQSLFYLLDNSNFWVIANFKETNLTKIEPGQDVEIKVDAFPNAKLKGKIENLSPATGARFSLLPPDNATGNFVKTVQRLPIKINFTEENEQGILKKLSSGLNVKVDVHIP